MSTTNDPNDPRLKNVARDARQAAPDVVREFADALYALPARLADAISLHPYAVADALVDLLDSGATS